MCIYESVSSISPAMLGPAYLLWLLQYTKQPWMLNLTIGNE